MKRRLNRRPKRGYKAEANDLDMGKQANILDKQANTLDKDKW